MSYYLFLDDMREPSNVTWVKLPDVDWVVVRDYYEFVQTICERGIPKFISFDHDLCRAHMVDYFDVAANEDKILDPLKLNYKKYKEPTGYCCARWLIGFCGKTKLPEYDVHSANHIGARNIRNVLEAAKLNENNPTQASNGLANADAT